MSKEKQPCEAPTHSEFCSCQTCTDHRCNRCPLITKDHFTGRAVAALLGWTRKEVNDSENWQWLSTPCHRAKDQGTQKVLRTLQQQKRGKFIGLGEHPRVGLTDDYDRTA